MCTRTLIDYQIVIIKWSHIKAQYIFDFNIWLKFNVKYLGLIFGFYYWKRKCEEETGKMVGKNILGVSVDVKTLFFDIILSISICFFQ